MRRVVLSKNDLHSWYCQQGLSLRQICRKTGHDLKTIIQLMRQHGITRRTTRESWLLRPRTSFDLERFQTEYTVNGHSLERIASDFGTNRGTLVCWAKANGFRIKTASDYLTGVAKTLSHRQKISMSRKALLASRPDMIEKIRENRLKQILPRETSIERILGETLAEAGVAYYKQLPILKTCQADLAFPDEKLAVFCDGDYWHRRPDVAAKDIRVNRVLRDNGWLVLRFWERDIKTDPHGIVRQIINQLLVRRYFNGLSSPQMEMC